MDRAHFCFPDMGQIGQMVIIVHVDNSWHVKEQPRHLIKKGKWR